MKIATKSLVVGITLLASTGLAQASAPASCDGEGRPPMAHHLKKMARELGLSPQQKQQVQDIFKKNKPQVQPLFQDLVTERRALRTLIQADTIDETAIRAQSAKVAAIQADLAVQRAHTAQELRAVLTPEQIDKFRAIQQKRDQRMDKFRDRDAQKAGKE